MIQPLLRLRSRLLVFLTHTVALPVLNRLHLYRSSTPFPYTAAQLRHLPPGTVGHDMITMLDSNDFQLVPYYEKHDIKHIVFGYPTTEKGEVAMQFFMLGNGLVSFPILATVVMGLFTMPDYYKSILVAFRRGRCTGSLAAVNWLNLMESNTLLVQQTLLVPTHPSQQSVF